MKKLLLTITTLLATATMSAFDSGGLSFTVIDSEKKRVRGLRLRCRHHPHLA